MFDTTRESTTSWRLFFYLVDLELDGGVQNGCLRIILSVYGKLDTVTETIEERIQLYIVLSINMWRDSGKND